MRAQCTYLGNTGVMRVMHVLYAQKPRISPYAFTHANIYLTLPNHRLIWSITEPSTRMRMPRFVQRIHVYGKSPENDGITKAQPGRSAAATPRSDRRKCVHIEGQF